MSLPLNMFPYVICNAFVNNEDTSNFFIIVFDPRNIGNNKTSLTLLAPVEPSRCPLDGARRAVCPQADKLDGIVKALIGRAMTPRVELLQHTLERVSCDWAAMPSVSRVGTVREGGLFL